MAYPYGPIVQHGRKLQIIRDGSGHMYVIDKETQEPIEGVTTDTMVTHTPSGIWAEIHIMITDPNDIFPTREVEGTVDSPVLQLPEPDL